MLILVQFSSNLILFKAILSTKNPTSTHACNDSVVNWFSCKQCSSDKFCTEDTRKCLLMQTETVFSTIKCKSLSSQCCTHGHEAVQQKHEFKMKVMLYWIWCWKWHYVALHDWVTFKSWKWGLEVFSNNMLFCVK